MTNEELTLSILAIVMGTGILIFILVSITSLAKTWINRNKGGYDEETFNRLAKAFMQHKKDMEQRMEKVESALKRAKKEIKSNTSTLQIEEPEQDNYLHNDLESRPKQRVK